MPIDFVCPNCFRPYSAPDDVAGRAMSCVGCATAFSIPLVKVPAPLPPLPLPPLPPLPPEPEPLEAGAAGVAPLAPLTPQIVPAAAPPPVPPPKVVVWQEPKRAAPDEEEDDRDEEDEYEAWLTRQKRKGDRERAKFWFWVKLALIVVCLVGIVVGIRVGLNRVDEVREHNKQMKGKSPR